LSNGGFFQGFGVIDHSVSLSKLTFLDLPDRSLNWISFLINRTQAVKCNNFVSSSRPIFASIVQGSVLGPMFYVVIAKDLKALSKVIHRVRIKTAP